MARAFLKCGDGLIVELQLRIQIADEIPGVGFVGNLRDVRESFDAFFGVAEIFIDETEVVPGVRILRKFCGGGGERRARRLEFLLSQERDAEIETRDFECGINAKRLFEIFLRIRRPLLVHISHA